MITMRDRVRRPIQANLKRFIFVVVVFSLALSFGTNRTEFLLLL
jgi:hypothetical protein